MKKTLLIIFAAVVGISAVAVITCPEKKDHFEAIMGTVKETMAEELENEKDYFDDEYGFLSGLSGLAEGFIGQIFNQALIVKNHFVYSEGFVSDGEKLNRVSVGVFGHVFTFSKEDLKRMIDEAL